MKRIHAAIACALLTVSAIATEKTYDLLWRPKPNESIQYRMSLRATVQENPFVLAGDLGLKIMKVSPTGDYTVESRLRNGTTRYMGFEEPIEEEAPDIQTFNAKGQLISETSAHEDDPMAQVLGQISDFTPPEKPVKVGDKWENRHQGQLQDARCGGQEHVRGCECRLWRGTQD